MESNYYEWPFTIERSDFVKRSHYINKKSHPNYDNDFLCILGGGRKEQWFNQINRKTHKINRFFTFNDSNNESKTNENENEKFGSLKDIKGFEGNNVNISFYVYNEKIGHCIVAIQHKSGYSVYNATNGHGEWIVECNKSIKTSEGMRALLFNDNLLIVSNDTGITFYDLTNLLEPKELGTILFASKQHEELNRLKYRYHGMLYLPNNNNNNNNNNYNDNNDNKNDKSDDNYKFDFKFALFGGQHQKFRLSTFEFNIKLNSFDFSSINNETDFDKHFKIVYKRIPDSIKTDEKVSHKIYYPSNYYKFATEYCFNKDNDIIILMFSGSNNIAYEDRMNKFIGKDIFIWNYTKETMIVKQDVMCLF